MADPLKAAALSQIEITTNAAGDQVIKFKLADKRPALDALGKHLGLFDERAALAVTVTRDASEPSVRELALAALALITEAAHEAHRPLELPAPLPEGPSPMAEAVRDDDAFDLDD